MKSTRKLPKKVVATTEKEIKSPKATTHPTKKRKEKEYNTDK
jgi:hypothetical protein